MYIMLRSSHENKDVKKLRFLHSSKILAFVLEVKIISVNVDHEQGKAFSCLVSGKTGDTVAETTMDQTLVPPDE